MFGVATGIAKLELYNNLRKPVDVATDGVTPTYPAGYVHLPQVDAEYVQQLCAERLVTRRDRNGYLAREWQKTRERNEALDGYVYARAAAAAAGLDRFEDRHWRELELPLGLPAPGEEAKKSVEPESSPPAEARGAEAKEALRPVIRSPWLGVR